MPMPWHSETWLVYGIAYLDRERHMDNSRGAICRLGKVLVLLERCKCPDFRRQHSGSTSGGSCVGIRSVVEQHCNCQNQGRFSLARSAPPRRGAMRCHETRKNTDVLFDQLHVIALSFCFHISYFAFLNESERASLEELDARQSKDEQCSNCASPVLERLLTARRPGPLGDSSDLPA